MSENADSQAPVSESDSREVAWDPGFIVYTRPPGNSSDLEHLGEAWPGSLGRLWGQTGESHLHCYPSWSF